MTILGKVLVFFVLILSLAWTALTVNAFVTRTNFKKALDDANKKLDEAAASARNQQKYASDIADTAAVALAQKDEEIKRLTQKVSAETTARATAEKQLADKQAGQIDLNGQLALSQSNVAKTQAQVDQLQKSQTELEKRANDSQIAAEKAKDDKLQAEIERDAQGRRANQLEQAKLKGSGGIDAAPEVPADFKATVTAVTGDQIEINLGANAGLQKGSILSISRTKPEPKYVGQLVITTVRPFDAVGRFVPRAGVRSPSGPDLPAKDDTASVIR